MGKDENRVEDFASAMGAAFDVEISRETVEEEKVEELAEEKLENILPDWQDEELEDYESPSLKKLLAAGKGVCRGSVSSRELQTVLQDVRKELDKAIKGFAEVKEAGKMKSFTEQELMVRIDRAFDLHKEALDEINKYFTDKNNDHIMDGLDLARSAVNRLYKSFVLFNQTKWGDNSLGARQGWAGASRLAKSIEMEESNVDIVIGGENKKYYTNPNFERLRQELEMLKGGKISEEKFAATIDWMLDNIASARKDSKAIDKSSLTGDNAKIIEEVLAATLEALDTYEKGLEEMKKYFTDKVSVHLDKGFRMAFEATQVISQIQLASEPAKEKKEESK
ncbi:MAG: hypothetical protein ABRQ38_18920 [Candidatus Eremiobacterota bacterium]